MKDRFRDIRPYRVGAILWITDFIVLFPLLNGWAKKRAKSLTLDYLGDRTAIEADLKKGAFFMTNHRDIVMDAAWLSYLLRKRYFIRPFMGVGNNLFAKPWIKFVMRYLRCFAVKRGAGIHAQLENSKQLSAYIRMLREQGKSIWLAQREGRAKDSNDTTSPSVMHMLALAYEEDNKGFSDFIDYIKMLNICPVSITYEFDPCDFLKATEMQYRRDDPTWRKSKRDDVISMQTGINGYKGRVVYRLTPSINHTLDQMIAADPEYRNKPMKELIQDICTIIDRQIHQGYEIFERGTEFDEYIESRIEKINIPNKDEAFLREKLYEMYSNPEKNHRIAVES